MLIAFASLTALPCCADNNVDAAQRLATDLTPVGAIRRGNDESTIPPWSGGLSQPPAGHEPGKVHVDPFSDDTPLFRIDSSSIERYEGKLTPAQLAMLRRYTESYYLQVYPARRSAAFPQRIYAKTVDNASTGKLTSDGEGVLNVAEGFPFPIPETGRELIWNHKLRFRGLSSSRRISLVNATAGGAFQNVSIQIQVLSQYHQPGATLASIDNRLLYLLQTIESPARLAGNLLLVHESLNQALQPRTAWIYNPSRRRVQRAPNVAYDNPSSATDGLAVSDMADMFNGAMDRFDWELKGRREIYVPYNAYRIHATDVDYAQLVLPGHLDPSQMRYELHRVWVVEATLREGQRHINSKRTYYLDEDSYQILIAEHYDKRGELWRFSEAHPVVYYEVPMLWTSVETHHDLQSGRFVSYRLDNSRGSISFDEDLSASRFTPQSLRRMGKR